MLEARGRSAIGFVRSANLLEREKVLGTLMVALKEKGVAIKQLNFAENRVHDLLGALQSYNINPSEENAPCIVLTDLEDSIKDKSSKPTVFIRNLNLDRDRLRRAIVTPLLFWLKPESYSALQEGAPDFFDYRAATFDFSDSKFKNTAGREYKVFVSGACLDNAEKRKIVLDAITMAGMVWHGMELFTSSDRFTVEERLRLVQEADLLAGVIAWRYGWEPNGEKSIIEMEYEAAGERLIFQRDPSLPVSIEKDFDPEPDRWDKQKKLDSFKKRFTGSQSPIYYNDTTLGAKLLHELNKWRNLREPDYAREAFFPDSKHVSNFDPELDSEILSYCEKAELLHATLPVAGFVTQLKVPIDVEDIYVPLRGMIDLRGIADEVFSDAIQAEKSLKCHESNLEIPLPEAFRQSEMRGTRGIVILGDPGSGKTTHLKRLLLWCLRNGPETIGLPSEMLPVFLPLRELQTLDQGLDAFIQEQLDSPLLKTPIGFGQRLLERGNLLLLLDGLDEVADLIRREQVVKWIKDALHSLPTCRFVVTCRYAGYRPTIRLSEDFLEMHIRPLTADLAERFVRNWYKIVERGLSKDLEQAESIALEKAENLITRLREPDFRTWRVFELTRNPLLLANICLVHRHRGGLPRKRARLYEECIDVLLEQWREAKGLGIGVTAREGLRALQPVALWLHSVEGRTKATADELAPLIEPVLKAINWSGGSAEDFLHIIRDESGLLTGWDQEHYGFMHPGFQEYLAAREIRSRAFKAPHILRELASHFGDSWWREVALLMLALEDPSLFGPYMSEVVKQPSFTKHPKLVEACLDDSAETSTEPFLQLMESTGDDPNLWSRQLAALQILERLDPSMVKSLQSKLANHPSDEICQWARNQAVQETRDIITAERGGYELVKIPGGTFLMGSSKMEEDRFDDEGPVHEVRVPSFYMGRYPVTNKEYERYLRENSEAVEPKYWADRRYNMPEQPVVGVSWEDAERYADWAGLRLPTEAEWEYACRAGTVSRYYSGTSKNDFEPVGWYEKNSEGRLHAVGEKEPNDFGLYDMHGNVWEWVEDDWHDDYKGAFDDGSAWVDMPRDSKNVVRGGTWGGPARVCRSASRDKNSKSHRYAVIGFRLARSQV